MVEEESCTHSIKFETDHWWPRASSYINQRYNAMFYVERRYKYGEDEFVILGTAGQYMIGSYPAIRLGPRLLKALPSRY